MANIQKSLGRINVIDMDELYKDDSKEKGEWSDISEDALKSMFIAPEPMMNLTLVCAMKNTVFALIGMLKSGMDSPMNTIGYYLHFILKFLMNL
jgi:hypothetical protein